MNSAIIILLGFIFTVKSQVTCSGTYVFGAGDCNQIEIGDGTAGTIEICVTVNNIASGGGSSCNPGGACNPPFNGGGWGAGLYIYASSGAGSTGALEGLWTAASGTGCYTMTTSTGYAYIYALCQTTGTTITWETLDPCGFDLCSGPAPPCIGTNCSTCAVPCGTAQGFPGAPSVADVVSGCTTLPFIPELAAGSTNTFCFSFTATATSVDFGVIITSDCGGGNVTNFSWELYSSSCGATVQTGTLASLTFSPVVVNDDYVFCYTFDVPGTCTHTQHCPYFVGAIVLPITLTNFTAKAVDDSNVQVNWKTKNEKNNDFFTIERSSSGKTFEVVGIVDGAGNSSNITSYEFQDKSPLKGITYYRLKQTDFDGVVKYSRPIVINTFDNDLTKEIIAKYDLLGRPIGDDYTGFVIIIYNDGSKEKLYISNDFK